MQTAAATAEPLIQTPAPLAFEPREVQAFIDSTEPQCAAHAVYAAEDARDLEYVARELVSTWRRQCARLQSMSYATKAFDPDDLLARLAEQYEEDLTPDAARLFCRYVELYAVEG